METGNEGIGGLTEVGRTDSCKDGGGRDRGLDGGHRRKVGGRKQSRVFRYLGKKGGRDGGRRQSEVCRCFCKK